MAGRLSSSAQPPPPPLGHHAGETVGRTFARWPHPLVESPRKQHAHTAPSSPSIQSISSPTSEWLAAHCGSSRDPSPLCSTRGMRAPRRTSPGRLVARTCWAMLRAITLAHPAATQGEGSSNFEFVGGRPSRGAWRGTSTSSLRVPATVLRDTLFLKAGRRKQGQRRRLDGERRQR